MRSTYNYVVLALCVLTQSAVLVMLVRKRLYRQLPIFCGYTLYTLCASLVGTGIDRFGTPPQYFYFFWISNVISVALGFAVIREVFLNVLDGFHSIQRLANLLFAFVVFMLVVMAVFTGVASSRHEVLQVQMAIISFERAVRFVQLGLVMFLFSFTRVLGLPWKHYLFGIALGFGIFAMVNLVIFGVRSQMGTVVDSVIGYLTPTAYLVATITWTVYLAMPAPQALRELPRHDLARWDTAIKDLLPR